MVRQRTVVVRGRLPTLVPRDERERCVIQVWRQSGLTDGTITVYLCATRRYRVHLRSRGYAEIDRLTRAAVKAYATSYVGPRSGRRGTITARRGSLNAIHAWSCALRLLGVSVPPWRSAPVPRRWPALVRTYGEYRREHRGVAATTLVRDQQIASDFLRFLRRRGRSMAGMQVSDLDAFIDGLSSKLARRTVAGQCSCQATARVDPVATVKLTPSGA